MNYTNIHSNSTNNPSRYFLTPITIDFRRNFSSSFDFRNAPLTLDFGRNSSSSDFRNSSNNFNSTIDNDELFRLL